MDIIKEEFETLMEQAATPAPLRKHTILCGCCGLPIGYIIGGHLIIRSRHHGEPHTNIVPLSGLASALNGAQTINISPFPDLFEPLALPEPERYDPVAEVSIKTLRHFRFAV